MRSNSVALVARASEARMYIARYLRGGGFEVFDCDELAIANRFVGIVLVDDQEDGDPARLQVQAWIKSVTSLRVVVITAKPAAWKPLALALSDRLIVLAAPAFGWEIVDSLRPLPPELPGAG